MITRTIQFCIALFASMLIGLVILINCVIPPPVKWWMDGRPVESPEFHGAAKIEYHVDGSVTAHKWRHGIYIEMWKRRCG
jgi:hypothetical protein